MMRTLYLAWQYIRYNRLKTVILIVCLTIMMALPLTVHRLVANFESGLLLRARTTPLVVGARGSRFDLTLHALHFRNKVPGPVTMRTVAAVQASGLATAIPLHHRFTARKFPIVGTSLEYLEWRALVLEQGLGLIGLGDCVTGATVARTLGLSVDDRLMSDPVNVFDIAGSYPVNMRVAGVLEPAGTSDDDAVFVDVKTAWLIEGLAHGHVDVVREAREELVLMRSRTNVTANAALANYTEVTHENMGSFHFHGDPDDFPLTAIVVIPPDRKSATILRGRYQDHPTLQMVVPETVVGELVAIVFRAREFLDTNLVIVGSAMALLLGLVIVLSAKLRQREMAVMFMLGCARRTQFRLQVAELVIIAGVSLVLAAAIARAAVWFAPVWLGL